MDSMSKYFVYPVYGKDRDGQTIIGCSKSLNSDKPFEKNSVILAARDKVNSDNFIVIDWKRNKVKSCCNGRITTWESFKSNEFWRRFRFSTPCEDWEIQAYGHIRW